MRLRSSHSSAASRIGINMTPMIDAVFLLLIFFMLTMRIIAPEGNLDARIQRVSRFEQAFEDTGFIVRVRCTANPDGSLSQLYFGNAPLGADTSSCWELLSSRMFALTGGDELLAAGLPVQIETDPLLAYEHTLHAISACTGRFDPASGRLVRCSASVTLVEP
jgi:biopolymer transport protein ExbD